MADSKIPISCGHCARVAEVKPRKDGTPKLPNSWMRWGDSTWCDGCWRKAFIRRGIVLPVHSCTDLPWADFVNRLYAAWRASTRCANWAIQQLLALDHMPISAETKLPKMPAVYLYGLHQDSGEPFADIRAATRQCIFREVQSKYMKKRFDVLVRGDAAPPVYRFPFPIIIDESSWRFVGREVNLLLGDSRVTLVLAKKNRHRQIRQIQQIIDGEAVPGAISIYRVRAGNTEEKTKRAGGGNSVSWRYMLKIGAWLPREAEKEKSEREASISLGGASFCTIRVDTYDRPWVLNAPQVIGMIRAHAKRVHQFSEDLKYEKRWPTQIRRRMTERLDIICSTHRRRMESWMHQSTAMVANYCARHGVASLRIESRESFGEFGWAGWITILRVKTDERNIEVREATASAEVMSRAT